MMAILESNEVARKDGTTFGATKFVEQLGCLSLVFASRHMTTGLCVDLVRWLLGRTIDIPREYTTRYPDGGMLGIALP
jgi:hypothetical protein